MIRLRAGAAHHARSLDGNGACRVQHPSTPECAHNWADLLRLLDGKRLALDPTLDDADRSRRIRDVLREHDGEVDS